MKLSYLAIVATATLGSAANIPLASKKKLLAFNETIPFPQLNPKYVSLDWVAGDDDGEYISADSDGSLVIANAVTGLNRTFVPASRVPHEYRGYWINADATLVLWAVNATQSYRHSYKADYAVMDVQSGQLTKLVPDSDRDIQFAAWSPTGRDVAFVRGNDLYLWSAEGARSRRVTHDGGPDTFNGVPDWVYEEEVVVGRSTLWWSPDGTKIAFLTFDERGVGEFDVEYFADNTAHGPAYPRRLLLRYPKAGSTNPKVKFNLLDVATAKVANVPIKEFPADDLIVGEVAWITDNSTNVLYRAYNRVQDSVAVVNVHVETGSTLVVRERTEAVGWLDNSLAIRYIGSIGSDDSNGTYYLDVSDESGWNHIYLFPTEGGDPIALTSGEWEVRSVLKVDHARGLVYYTSTERHSTESHLYSVSYLTKKKRALVDDSKEGYWTASFSKGGSIYELSYLGPGVPYQQLYSIKDSVKALSTIEDNAVFAAERKLYNLPAVSWFEIPHPSGTTLNVLQRLPANFDPKKKYPVLFNPYGGPGSQSTAKTFQGLNWNAYISSDSELEYIQWVVDNRGTGFKGRAFRAQVGGRLGYLEARDQSYAAEWLVSHDRDSLLLSKRDGGGQQEALVAKPRPTLSHEQHSGISRGAVRASSVDAAHVTHWGWSFGGFLTAKVLELNSGVFSQGLITAPVTDWRFYDSVYTERYMKTPALNPEGYEQGAVRDAQGFKDVPGGFEIFHGLGDDNVHYQNTAVLTDLLFRQGVTPATFSQVAFSDSAHSISYGGDRTFLYKAVTARLWAEKRRTEKLGGHAHQWSKRKEEKEA